MEKGITLTEVLIVVVLVGLLAAVVAPQMFGAQSAASTVKCLANLENFASEVNLMCLEPGTPPPTQEQVRDYIGWGQGRYDDYWYVPNNSDRNKGHGNDLDLCDEENPGASSRNRNCIPVKFIIICRHESHGAYSDAKYCFKTDFLVAKIVPRGELPRTYLKDASWYPGDPGYDRFIGWTPKQ